MASARKIEDETEALRCLRAAEPWAKEDTYPLGLVGRRRCRRRRRANGAHAMVFRLLPSCSGGARRLQGPSMATPGSRCAARVAPLRVSARTLSALRGDRGARARALELRSTSAIHRELHHVPHLEPAQRPALRSERRVERDAPCESLGRRQNAERDGHDHRAGAERDALTGRPMSARHHCPPTPCDRNDGGAEADVAGHATCEALRHSAVPGMDAQRAAASLGTSPREGARSQARGIAAVMSPLRAGRRAKAR